MLNMETAIISSTESSGKLSLNRALLWCGILSSLFYFALNLITPFLFEGYNVLSQTVSELSAIDAPTRKLWVPLGIIYVLLFALFGIGILRTANENRKLRAVGMFILIYSLINIYWPPMHLRGNEPTLSDTLHIVWGIIANISMLVIMILGALALGKGFRYYTAATILLFFVFGYLTWLDAPNLANNLPTPYLGLWERILIALYMAWVIFFTRALLRRVKIDRNKAYH